MDGNWGKIYIDISDHNPAQEIVYWLSKRELVNHKHWFWDIQNSDFMDKTLCLRIHPDFIAEIFTVRVKWGS